MIWHVERFLSFRNLSKQLAIYSLLVYGRTKWIAISVWDFLIFSSKISPFSVWVFLHSPLHAAAKESKGGERGSSLMIRTWSRYVRTQIATGPFSSLWETIGIEWASKRTDANALSSLSSQCEYDFKSKNGLKIHVSFRASEKRSGQRGLGSGQECQQRHYHRRQNHHHQALCMLTVCYYHVSVLPLNRYFGRMATTPRTTGSWEHLLMCQRCAVCMVQKILVRSCSFSKTTFV